MKTKTNIAQHTRQTRCYIRHYDVYSHTSALLAVSFDRRLPRRRSRQTPSTVGTHRKTLRSKQTPPQTDLRPPIRQAFLTCVDHSDDSVQRTAKQRRLRSAFFALLQRSRADPCPGCLGRACVVRPASGPFPLRDLGREGLRKARYID